jgi:flagellar protein FliO/FliZ
MYTNIIGTQQILITAAFLGVMVLLLIILRKKSTVIRANMRAGKRINIIEDTAVSPTERLRLVSVDSERFIMISAKGHAPSLVCLNAYETKPLSQGILDNNKDSESDEMKAALAGAMEAHSTSKRFEKLSINPLAAVRGTEEVNQNEEQQAFAEKFRSWRQQNDAR